MEIYETIFRFLYNILSVYVGYRTIELFLGDICLKELQDMLSCQFLQETGYFLHVEKIRENKCYNVK